MAFVTANEGADAAAQARAPNLEPLTIGHEMDENENATTTDGLLDPVPGAPIGAPLSKNRSTAYLDGLRGLAAFLVYISHHYVWMYGTEDPAHLGFGHNGVYAFSALPFVRVFFTGGAPGVAIFFVLSGYVLSRSPLGMLRGGSTDVSALRVRLLFSAIRRPFRLFIPVIGISLAFALSMHLPLGMGPLVSWPTPQDTILSELWVWAGEVLRVINPFVPHGVRQKWFPYNPPSWTISIEFAGSILVFALVGLLPFIPTRLRGGALILLGLVFLFAYQWAMAGFVAGIVLAMSDLEGVGYVPRLSHLSAASKSALYNATFLLGWYLLSQPSVANNVEASLTAPGWSWLTTMLPPSYYNDEYWRFWNDVGAVMIVFATIRLRWLQGILLTSPLQWLGRVSFSLYLTQFPLLWAVGDRVYRLFGTRPDVSVSESWFDNRLAIADLGPHGLSARFIVVQLVMLPINLLVAKWCTVLLDEPSVRVSRWVEAKIRGTGTLQEKESNNNNRWRQSIV